MTEDPQALTSWLVVHLAQVCELDPCAIDVHARFHQYGLTSVAAVRLIAELSRVVDRPLSPMLVWEAPTIASLVRRLTGASEDEGSTSDDLAAHEPQEPIAIVGMACRLPGAASPEAFWRLLRDGIDAV